MQTVIRRYRWRLISRVVTSLTAVLVLTTGVASASPAPSRPTFDWKTNQVGATSGPVFNSFINTPTYGDERAFFTAGRSDQVSGHNTGFTDTVGGVTGGSQQVVLRIYVNNNANQALNGHGVDGKGVAHDTEVRVTLPDKTGKQLQAVAYINAGNASPNEVSDTAQFTDSTAFSLQYIAGSAVIYNAAHPTGSALSDDIVNGGTPVGYQNMDGNFPGSFSFQAIIELRVRVISSSTSQNGQQSKPLSNTGPGSTVAVFVIAMAAGTIGYRLYLSRRLSH